MAAFGSARFRHVLGHHPTGVTVVTGTDAGVPHGMTMGSFTSVSLDPPLVGFLPSKVAASWPEIQRSGAFCVNLLGEGQGDLCWRFAEEKPDRFEGVAWHPGPTGSPILDGVAAYLDCEIHEVLPAGDHVFVLGRVVDLDVVEGASPLLFLRGQLGRFAAS
jgi:flavin reductase (DIM6/NTAB) family NADH-FMN oxidoreductase RutF